MISANLLSVGQRNMMKLATTSIVCMAAFTLHGVAHGDVIEVGDLNIIDDPGNPSDGLRFLDMSYSHTLTLSAALANAQATYPDARLATPGEWDDLFSAAGINYSVTESASDAFEIGDGVVLSSAGDYDGGLLSQKLGYTDTLETWFWSDPDGDIDAGTTRDYMTLRTTFAGTFQTTVSPPHPQLGWLLVSEVPEPSTVLLLATSVGMGLLLLRRRG